ncbi:MAG TPA: hypothetical protein VEK79_13970 [Thermoanaerobaculia bacterium]|nr:hypothetical protein [Burkholderiales bacterium]HYC60668.1 hypothetical protein [Thermoanaerobaculia bacterium]
MARTETSERKSSSRSKKSGNGSGGGGAKSMLRNVVGGSAATDTLIDLVERLGLVDIVVGRVKSRIEETDVDDLLDEATEYLRRNPEVLVVTLGAVTAATGLLVWLNSRREWDGSERRTPVNVTSAPGRVRRTTSRSEQ